MRPMCSCSAQAMAADVKRSNAIAIAQAIRPRLLTAVARAAALKTDSSVLSGQSLRIAYVSAAAETNMKPCSVHRRHRAVYCGPRLPNQCVSAEAEAEAEARD